MVQMDADLSHQPQYIPPMIATLVEADADVVIGSRYVAGGSLAEEWALPRRLLSAWANFYVNAILGTHIRDVTAGFKVWRASMLGKIGLDAVHSQGYSFQVEMYYRTQRLGGKLVESPIHFHERNTGLSKMDFQAKWESAKMPLRLRWSTDVPAEPDPWRLECRPPTMTTDIHRPSPMAADGRVSAQHHGRRCR